MRPYVPLFALVMFGVLALYGAIAEITYRFRHPEQTETQRILHAWDVIRFR